MHPIYAAYLDRLEALHADIAQALAGLPPAALDWSPAPEINRVYSKLIGDVRDMAYSTGVRCS